MRHPWDGQWVPSVGAQTQTVPDQESGQGHLVSVGSLKNTHPYLLLPSRKPIPGDFPAYLEVKETFQQDPNFQRSTSFLLCTHGASPICAGLSSAS